MPNRHASQMILIEFIPRKSIFIFLHIMALKGVDSLGRFKDLLLSIDDEDFAEDEKLKIDK